MATPKVQNRHHGAVDKSPARIADGPRPDARPSLGTPGDSYQTLPPSAEKPAASPKSVDQETADLINTRLAQCFAGRDHIVQIENVGGELRYVLHWRNKESSRKDTVLPFGVKDELIETTGFIGFRIGQQDVKLVTKIVSKRPVESLVLEDKTSFFQGNIRAIVIPVDAALEFVNYNKVVEVASHELVEPLTDRAGARTRFLNEVAPALYTAEIYKDGRKKYHFTPLKIAEKHEDVKPPPTEGDKPKPALQPREILTPFVRDVVKTVLDKKEPPKAMDLYIVLDVSCKNQHAKVAFLLEIQSIIRALQHKGVSKIRIGIGAFGDGDGWVETVQKFTDVSSLNEKSMGALIVAAYGLTLREGCHTSPRVSFSGNEVFSNSDGSTAKKVVVFSNSKNIVDHQDCERALVFEMKRQAQGADVDIVHVQAAPRSISVLRNVSTRTHDGFYSFAERVEVETLEDPSPLKVDAIRRKMRELPLDALGELVSAGQFRNDSRIFLEALIAADKRFAVAALKKFADDHTNSHIRFEALAEMVKLGEVGHIDELLRSVPMSLETLREVAGALSVEQLKTLLWAGYFSGDDRIFAEALLSKEADSAVAVLRMFANDVSNHHWGLAASSILFDLGIYESVGLRVSERNNYLVIDSIHKTDELLAKHAKALSVEELWTLVEGSKYRRQFLEVLLDEDRARAIAWLKLKVEEWGVYEGVPYFDMLMKVDKKITIEALREYVDNNKRSTRYSFDKEKQKIRELEQ